MKLLIIGPQGSGKGTQAKKLADHFSIAHISTGDIFRENIKKKTELGKKAEDLMNAGNLVPDDLTNDLVKDRLTWPDCENGFILDGYPRNMLQANFLDALAEIDAVLLLDIPKEVTIQRISSRRVCKKCGANFNVFTIPPKKEGVCDSCESELVQREDDTEDAVEKRLQLYAEQTKPLIDFYKEKGLVKEVDGTKSIEDVFQDLLAVLS